MRLLHALTLIGMLLALPGVGAVGMAQTQPPEAAREEYVPIDELPPEAELPAAPMVIAAYSFVWAAFVVYVISIVRRMQRVEADLRALERTPASPKR